MMQVLDSPRMQPIGIDGAAASGSGSKLHTMPRRVFVGAIISPESLVSLRFIKRGVLGVGSTGVIRFVDDLDDVERTQAARGFQMGKHSAATSRNSSAARTITNDNEPVENSNTGTPVAKPKRIPNEAGSKISSGASKADAGHAGLEKLPPPAIEPPNDKQEEEQALVERVVASHGWQLEQCELVTLSPNSFLCPGFIDTHTHAPQVPNLGRGQQYELLDWLENVTFPREKKFEDTDYAYRTYDSVIQRMLDAGTTCAAIYATLHEEATMILADICNERGMRAFVGKCQMDRNSPQDYCEKGCAQSMDSTRRFVQYCRELQPYSPGSPRRGIGSPSSGSPEMDESIQRLTTTMNNILKQEQEKKGQSASYEEQSSTGSSMPSTSQSDLSRSSSSTASSASTSDAQEGRPRHHSSASSHSSASASTGKAGTGAKTTSRKLKAYENAYALVQPILTPRFAISCSDALLAAISAYVTRDPTLRIQTHLSENGGEIAFTKSLFPFCETYTDVYDHFGLLTPRTILAHAIHLEEDEMQLISERKCGISHCPTSNMNLRSGTSRVGEMLNRGIKVGLGTDMSGGFGLSILSAIRDASVVAKVVQFSKEGSEDKATETTAVSAAEKAATHDFCKGPLPIATLFYLATLGGAEVCSVAHRVGSLDEGKEFDALLINTANGCPNLFIEEDEDTLEQKFEKFLFCGDDRNIASVFVRGRVVGGSAPIAPSVA